MMNEETRQRIQNAIDDFVVTSHTQHFEGYNFTTDQVFQHYLNTGGIVYSELVKSLYYYSSDKNNNVRKELFCAVAHSSLSTASKYNLINKYLIESWNNPKETHNVKEEVLHVVEHIIQYFSNIDFLQKGDIPFWLECYRNEVIKKWNKIPKEDLKDAVKEIQDNVVKALEAQIPNIANNVASPWQCETNNMVRRLCGKLGEESSELSQVCHRIDIQSLNALVPGETYTNKHWLEQEIADVLATIHHAIDKLNLNAEFINERKLKKINYLEPWLLGQLDNLK